ncbi:MAG: topoisomerase DNA-binding C4 zinc finger domain-containing protein [Clostridia bacterium]|nr:topoisomerase DNA-binding C4 zinc finger domain-containing protein [Clostridia bacterium]
MQNHSHIKHLRTLIGEQIPMRSVIVFSDRCTLKSVQIHSNDINVIYRYNIAPVVSEICKQTPLDVLSDSDISEIYNKLYPFTQVDEIAKVQHISNIHNNLNGKSVRKIPSVTPTLIVQKSEMSEHTTTTESISAPEDSVDVAESPAVIAESKPVETPQQPAKCPWCNGNLILRTATRGANAGNQFYGCSNYPKCKYIQNVTNSKMV